MKTKQIVNDLLENSIAETEVHQVKWRTRDWPRQSSIEFRFPESDGELKKMEKKRRDLNRSFEEKGTLEPPKNFIPMIGREVGQVSLTGIQEWTVFWFDPRYLDRGCFNLVMGELIKFRFTDGQRLNLLVNKMLGIR